MTDKILITSALPYINGVKHLGNLAGSILPADVHARFHRLRGCEVLFVCGTDEHGTPAELAAAQAGLPVAEFCARQHAIQADIYRRFAISFDHFSRSSSSYNHALTQELFRRLDANGLIEERVTPQIWSVADNRFLPDRYVIGTCPHCGHEAARGDQCDGCSRLLDPTELVAPRSAISGASDLEIRESRHLFLRQSVLAEQLRAWHATQEDWDPLVRSIAAKWLDEGLADRGITRDLGWGIAVPRPGFAGKVFYVWFDAPIGYIAAVQEWAALEPGRDWQSWWRPGPGVRYVQFLGKDNVPFHAISFPATILGSGAEIRLVDRIKGFNWLNYGGGKFSTSARRGVFTDAALDELPADAWRWWLTANAPETSDVQFTFARFAEGVNADLADNFGNLVNRLLSFARSRFDGAVPDGGAPGAAEAELHSQCTDLVATITDDFEAIRLRRAAAGIRALWALGNAYLTREAPWSAIGTDRDRAACVTRTALNLLRICAAVAAPIIPGTAASVLAALGEPPATAWPQGEALALDALPHGQAVTCPAPLFPRLTAEWVETLTTRYGS
jgi:methionyl-tRNA synthetase